jgi:hypothetical protein
MKLTNILAYHVQKVINDGYKSCIGLTPKDFSGYKNCFYGFFVIFEVVHLIATPLKIIKSGKSNNMYGSIFVQRREENFIIFFLFSALVWAQPYVSNLRSGDE